MAIDKVRMSIISSIFQREISDGHLAWSVAEVSRETGISRSTIYYHFGANKEAILNKALHAICEEYYGLSWDRLELAKMKFEESAIITRRLYEQNPCLVVFYQKWRHIPSYIGDILVTYERRYFQKLQNLFPHLSNERITSLYAHLHGLITSPFIQETDFRILINDLLIELPVRMPT